jgi:hypothetical protein
MRHVALVAVLAAAGCPRAQVKERAPLADTVSSSDGNTVALIVGELQDDVLSSYERDEPPEIATGMVAPDIGGARIGVGPGDVLVGPGLERAPSRWPLRVDPSLPTQVRSKRLETHLARDLSAAWVSDELSWRISLCGRIAVIPLRISMLYARDGDRWVPVFEHMSFGHEPAPHGAELYGARIPSKTVPSSDFVDELSAAVSPLLSGARRSAALATGPEVMLLGPDVTAEWHGLEVQHARLAPGPIKLVEDRRIGYVGRSFKTATIAYWIGNVVAELPAGKSRMRTTFVFEKRRLINAEGKSEEEMRELEAKSCADDATDCKWVLVQGHVSEPIGDQELASRVFGTAQIPTNLEAGETLRVACPDGAPPPPR